MSSYIGSSSFEVFSVRDILNRYIWVNTSIFQPKFHSAAILNTLGCVVWLSLENIQKRTTVFFSDFFRRIWNNKVKINNGVVCTNSFKVWCWHVTQAAGKAYKPGYHTLVSRNTKEYVIVHLRNHHCFNVTLCVWNFPRYLLWTPAPIPVSWGCKEYRVDHKASQQVHQRRCQCHLLM